MVVFFSFYLVQLASDLIAPAQLYLSGHTSRASTSQDKNTGRWLAIIWCFAGFHPSLYGPVH